MTRRVLFDARSSAVPRTTGWERTTRELAPRLAARGVDLFEMTRYRSPASIIWRDWWTLPRTSRPYDIVHFPTFPPSPAVAARRIVYTLYDLTWWLYPETASRLGRSYYRPLAARAVRSAWRIAVAANAVREELVEHLGADPARIAVIPPGASSLPVVQALKRDRPYLLAVGTREPRKNLDRLVKAFGVSGLNNEVELVLAGRRGWAPDVRGCTLLEPNDTELAGLYRGAVATVVPSLYEGFGLPVVESFAVGTPVVCSDIPSLREVAQSHATYFDPLDIESIAASLRAACQRSHREERVLQAVAARFSWEAAADSFIALYAEE